MKICGITNREDARTAAELGADALGFNFVSGTPRYVGAKPDLIELIDSVPPLISRVGVCVRPDDIDPEVLSHLDVLQVYDLTDLAGLLACCLRIIPVFRLQSADDINAIVPVIEQLNPRAVLLDTYHQSTLGGSGVTFDWRLASEAQTRFGVSVILAGGLTPANVADAIQQVQPYAVDVSSGVESAEPGRKDPAKLREFIHAALSA